jgi:hypothetical protein
MRVTFSVEQQVKDLERQNLISRPRGRAQKVALAKRLNSLINRTRCAVYRGFL